MFLTRRPVELSFVRVSSDSTHSFVHFDVSHSSQTRLSMGIRNVPKKERERKRERKREKERKRERKREKEKEREKTFFPTRGDWEPPLPVFGSPHLRSERSAGRVWAKGQTLSTGSPTVGSRV